MRQRTIRKTVSMASDADKKHQGVTVSSSMPKRFRIAILGSSTSRLFTEIGTRIEKIVGDIITSDADYEKERDEYKIKALYRCIMEESAQNSQGEY